MPDFQEVSVFTETVKGKNTKMTIEHQAGMCNEMRWKLKRKYAQGIIDYLVASIYPRWAEMQAEFKWNMRDTQHLIQLKFPFSFVIEIQMHCLKSDSGTRIHGKSIADAFTTQIFS